MNKVIVIFGKYGTCRKEIIDHVSTLEPFPRKEANRLIREYALAYGNDWLFTTKTITEKAFNKL